MISLVYQGIIPTAHAGLQARKLRLSLLADRGGPPRSGNGAGATATEESHETAHQAVDATPAPPRRPAHPKTCATCLSVVTMLILCRVCLVKFKPPPKRPIFYLRTIKWIAGRRGSQPYRRPSSAQPLQLPRPNGCGRRGSKTAAVTKAPPK